jgi:glycosyltransferase involved in cell wall biosynthesis
VAPLAWPVLARDAGTPLIGGAEVQQAILARLLARRGHRVSMITQDFGQSDRSVVDGVLVRKVFGKNHGVPVLRYLHPRLTTMWRALREVNADIYYVRSASMWVGVVAVFCRIHGRRLVYAGASDMDFVPQQGGQIRYARDRWLYRRGLAAADAIVAQNALQSITCLANYGREAVEIPSCYEPPKRAHAAEDLVLWVGTLHANKRPEMFLDLAARLPHRRCVMVGGPGADAALYERARERAAGLPNVEFKGFLPLAEAEAWFDRARVLVNTSLYEGTPNTFLQAWSRGVPTVATVDVGAPVHRVASTVDELVRETENAMKTPALGRACRDYFRRTHSSANVLSRYETLFGRLAA